MKEYTVTRTENPDWSRIPALTLEDTHWLPDCTVTASAQLCHNGRDLLLRMEAQEAQIRAELNGPLDQVCEDSCLEFFFAPDAEDPRYFNFEFNPLGNFYMGFGRERDTRVRLLPADQDQFHIRPYTTDTGWGLTCRIPGDFIGMFVKDFSFSSPAACNFYKCGELTEAPHYLAWSPLTCTEPDYHRRQDFGILNFR